MFERTVTIGEYQYTEALESYRLPGSRYPKHRSLGRWPADLTLEQAIALAIRQVKPAKLYVDIAVPSSRDCLSLCLSRDHAVGHSRCSASDCVAGYRRKLRQ